MLKNQLKNRLSLSNTLYLDLLNHIPESLLSSKLADLPSNTIGQQLWCVIGARNSYLKAAKAQRWQGFECPLEWDKTTSAESVRKALDSTGEQVSKFFGEATELSEQTVKFLLDLLEHEAQHHGQLSRYLYGLKVGVPTSWKTRYNFD
jgi:hypothetical protein